jgi:Asp-tRNA(Asn)/Glu-tRNA(Gln) amidotransferase A subunit family amidase
MTLAAPDTSSRPPFEAMSIDALVAAVVRREIDCVDIVRDCVQRVREREAQVHAFAHFDADWALEQARQRDADRRPLRLLGIPLAVKDIFDTCDFPTEYNSPIYRGNQSRRDAECVARARRAGAVLVGKTVTSEFAHVVLGPTVNPVDPRYSPGGSSSGSAAAVAAGFVPMALGSQTGGSGIRPGSYCGVFAFKPTYGRLPVAGMRPVAPSLDTVALFARRVSDLEAAFTALAAPKSAEPKPRTRRIVVCRPEAWGSAESDSERVLITAADAMARAGYDVDAFVLPRDFDALADDCMKILDFELSRSLAHEYEHARDAISAATRHAIETGRAIDAASMGTAYERQVWARNELEHRFERFDAILTFSAPGEPPRGHKNGDSSFNRVWTMLHVPCLNIPAGHGQHGLPVGVQLIGRLNDDVRLLALARDASAYLTRPVTNSSAPCGRGASHHD